jgi:hypothetical protein
VTKISAVVLDELGAALEERVLDGPDAFCS